MAALGLDRKFEEKDDVLLLMKQAAERGKGPKVCLAWGTEDFLVYGQNNAFYEILKTMPFASKYEAWPGVHDWTFWNVALPLMDVFKKERKITGSIINPDTNQ